MLFVELHHPVTGRVLDSVREDHGTFHQLGAHPQLVPQARPIEDVVSQDQADRLVFDKIPSKQESIRQAARHFLLLVDELDAPLLAASQKALEAGQVFRGADDHDLANARQQ